MNDIQFSNWEITQLKEKLWQQLCLLKHNPSSIKTELLDPYLCNISEQIGIIDYKAKMKSLAEFAYENEWFFSRWKHYSSFPFLSDLRKKLKPYDQLGMVYGTDQLIRYALLCEYEMHLLPKFSKKQIELLIKTPQAPSGSIFLCARAKACRLDQVTQKVQALGSWAFQKGYLQKLYGADGSGTFFLVFKKNFVMWSWYRFEQRARSKLLHLYKESGEIS